MGVKVERFFVQRMKTKWGSCNHGAHNIRLNTELAKKPRECLEYIVVHEMTHVLEPTHNARFIEIGQGSFRNVGNVARELFATELGFANFNIVFLNVDRGEDVFLHQALADDELTYDFGAATLLHGRVVNPPPIPHEFLKNQFVVVTPDGPRGRSLPRRRMRLRCPRERTRWSCVRFGPCAAGG